LPRIWGILKGLEDGITGIAGLDRVFAKILRGTSRPLTWINGFHRLIGGLPGLQD
jgi:hypothetical protein